MLRQCGFLLAIAGGVTLLAYGGAQWWAHQQVESVAVEFIEAMIAGNEKAALLRMEPEWRRRVQSQGRDFLSRVFVASPDTRFRVHHVERHFRDARVQFWIEREGYVIQPVLLMKRDASDAWHIAGFDKVEVDPLWKDLEQAATQQRTTDVTHELQEALRAGRDVEVAPLEEAPRR